MIGLVFTFASCGDKKKETVSEPAKEEVHEHHGEEVAMAAYQCPMKCEGEKTYSEAGICPTCKMDLKKVEEPAEESEEAESEE